MRIEKRETIYLSHNEADTWAKFLQILGGLERGSENPDTIDLINKIIDNMADLWEKIEDID